MGTQLLMSRIEDDDQQANHIKLRRCCVSEFLGYEKHDLIFYHSSIHSAHEFSSFLRFPVSTILRSALFENYINQDWKVNWDASLMGKYEPLKGEDAGVVVA